LLFYNRYLIKKQILILINRILELKNYDWN